MLRPFVDAWHWLVRRPTIADGMLAAALAATALVGMHPELQLVSGFARPDPVGVGLAFHQAA